MAFRTWAKLSGIAVGAAALAAASQLGLAYGLGILRLTRVVEVTARDQWTAQLAWVAWIAMTSAAVGGMAGRLHLPGRSGAGTRLITAVAAGIGAAAVVPLTMQPARTAQVAGVQPVFVIGVCAALGAVAGIAVAYAALSRSVARWSLTTIGVAVWVLAVLSVAPALGPGDDLPSARLGVLDASLLDHAITQRIALFTMPALALVCGVLLGWTARRRDLSTLTIALAGLPGPALLTLAYLVAGPGAGADEYQKVPYWAAMTAAGAGVLGSVLAAVLRRAPGSTAPPPLPEPHDPPAPERPPLPKRDAQPDSAIARAAATAAQRPPEELRPSDTGVFTVPEVTPFNGFAPVKEQVAHGSAAVPTRPQPVNAPPVAPQPVNPLPQPKPVRGDRRGHQDGEIADWVSGLGN